MASDCFQNAILTPKFEKRMLKVVLHSNAKDVSAVRVGCPGDLTRPMNIMANKTTLQISITPTWLSTQCIWAVNIRLLQDRLNDVFQSIERVDLFGVCLPSVVAMMCNLPRIRHLNVAPSYPMSGIVMCNMTKSPTLRTLQLNMMSSDLLGNYKQALTVLNGPSSSSIAELSLFNCHSMMEDEHVSVFTMPYLRKLSLHDHSNGMLSSTVDARWEMQPGDNSYTCCENNDGAMTSSIHLERLARIVPEPFLFRQL